MQNILSIDASQNPAQALVVRIDAKAKDISILEHHVLPCDSHDMLLQQLEALPEHIKSPWNNAILFVPGRDHISLNLALPFRDQRQLSKIVVPEVQDIIPFEVDAFALHHRRVGSLNGSGEDVHVGLMPKAPLVSILETTRASGIDPFIVSTPGSSLQGLYEIYGSNLAENAVVVLEHHDSLYMAVFVDRKIVADRSIGRAGTAPLLLGSRIELAIQSAEERYGVSLKTVYHICETATPVFNVGPEREQVRLSLRDLLPKLDREASFVATIGAIFAQDFPAPPILTNFRTGELSYRPSFKAFMHGLRQLSPYALALLLVLVIGTITWYATRERQIETMRETLLGEIRQAIPSFEALPGEEAQTLQRMSVEVQESLKELGSPLAAAPLDILSAVSEEVSSIEGVSTRRVSVRGGKALIEGTVPNYNTIDRLERALRKRKQIFCKVENRSPSSGGARENSREFQFDIDLCQT